MADPLKLDRYTSPISICAPTLDSPRELALPPAASAPVGESPPDSARCHVRAPASPASGISPAVIVLTNLAVLFLALAIFLPPVSEISPWAGLVAVALSPAVVTVCSGHAQHVLSDATLMALLLIDCVLAAIASATVLPLIPVAATTALSFAEARLRELVHGNMLARLSEIDFAQLAPVCAAGFAAQLVDGALGMGYGLTSSSVLAAAGLSPATASASVHLAQLGTTFVSGLAHHRHGNVDSPAMHRLSPAGAAGALIGALILSSVPVGAAKLVSGGMLFFLGLTVLLRFLLVGGGTCAREEAEPVKAKACGHASELQAATKSVGEAETTNERAVEMDSAGPPNDVTKAKVGAFLAPMGFLGGFVDATGGGGWGPVATSTLLSEGRLSPCRVIGTTSASEFFVTVAAVTGFTISSLLTSEQSSAGTNGAASHSARFDMVAALLVGGVAAAPIAPFLTAVFRPRVLGVTIGGFICFTNLKTILAALYHTGGVSRDGSRVAHTLLLLGWGAAIVHVSRAGGQAVGCAPA